MHVILWKFVIIELTRVELEGAKWRSENIWQQTIFRTRTRILAHAFGVRLAVMRNISRGKEVDKNAIERWNKTVKPLAKYNEEGGVCWTGAIAGAFLGIRTSG